MEDESSCESHVQVVKAPMVKERLLVFWRAVKAPVAGVATLLLNELWLIHREQQADRLGDP